MIRPIHTITRWGERNSFFRHRTVAEIIAAGEWSGRPRPERIVSPEAAFELASLSHSAAAPRGADGLARVVPDTARAVAREVQG